MSSSAGGSSSMSASGTGGGVVRELQKAKKESDVTAPTFTAFAGSANRIDGKALPAGSIDSKESREAMALKRLAALGANGRSVGVAETKEPSAVIEPPKSKIGDKYAKKKTAVSAFTGTGNKLG